MPANASPTYVNVTTPPALSTLAMLTMISFVVGVPPTVPPSIIILLPIAYPLPWVPPVTV